ncbi:MAG: acylphosphatase [Clostridia bacterium]|nr:acylphosphatase [Clostridia bacterium]
MQKIMDAAIGYIRTLFEGNADGHGFDHAMRVYGTAMRIADEEPAADREIVALAALLHDADDPKLFQTEDNANARRFLAEYAPDKAEPICAAINAVSYSKNGTEAPATIEGRIVQDADRLDAMGAVGIARTFAYGGAHGRSLASSLAHFHEKLLRLRDGMNTDAAKKMAESRHAFLEAFLAEWECETVTGTPPQRVIRRHLVFTGAVQGVGFRYRARHAADLYGCTGWVQNEYDGSVVMEIQGTEEQIDQVILAVERGTFVRIENMEAKTIPVIGDERGFRG